MLSINLAVWFQIVIFISVVLLCGPLLIKPTLKLLEERDAKTEGAKTRAKELDLETDARLQEIEARIVEARKLGAADREEIRTKKAQQAESLINTARKEAQKELDAMAQEISKEAGNARAALQKDVQTIARQIAGKLLGREVA